MPPLHWFSSDLSASSNLRTSPAPSSASSASCSVSSFEEKSGASSSGDEMLGGERHSGGGFRINPLQLIAAVSAMV
jgi:hypothetical protein